LRAFLQSAQNSFAPVCAFSAKGPPQATQIVASDT
jgi:hypothetical protein